MKKILLGLFVLVSVLAVSGDASARICSAETVKFTPRLEVDDDEHLYNSLSDYNAAKAAINNTKSNTSGNVRVFRCVLGASCKSGDTVTMPANHVFKGKTITYKRKYVCKIAGFNGFWSVYTGPDTCKSIGNQILTVGTYHPDTTTGARRVFKGSEINGKGLCSSLNLNANYYLKCTNSGIVCEKVSGGNPGGGNPGGGNPGGGNSGGGNPRGGSSTVSGPCGNEVLASNSDTNGNGRWVVHRYRVKGWPVYDGINDYNCTIKGQHLDVYEENGIWYTPKTQTCVSTSKRPGCTQAYREGQNAPAISSGSDDNDAKLNCERKLGTWKNGECVCESAKNLIKNAEGTCVCKEDTMEWNGAMCVVSAAYSQCLTIVDATWNAFTKKCACNDTTKEIDETGTKCVESKAHKLSESQQSAKVKIADALDDLRSYVSGLEVSKWKDEDGKFNTARLASDLTAGVVLGTAGALITSSVVKKNQVESGLEDISCTIGGQTVAGWGDEFTVGVH